MMPSSTFAPHRRRAKKHRMPAHSVIEAFTNAIQSGARKLAQESIETKA